MHAGMREVEAEFRLERFSGFRASEQLQGGRRPRAQAGHGGRSRCGPGCRDGHCTLLHRACGSATPENASRVPDMPLKRKKRPSNMGIGTQVRFSERAVNERCTWSPPMQCRAVCADYRYMQGILIQARQLRIFPSLIDPLGATSQELLPYAFTKHKSQMAPTGRKSKRGGNARAKQPFVRRATFCAFPSKHTGVQRRCRRQTAV